MKRPNRPLLARALRALPGNRQGATAVTFAITVVPIISLLGLSVNYAAVSQTRAAYQRIADSAVLAGATASATDSDSARLARTKAWFENQVAVEKLPPASVTASISNGSIKVTAEATFTPYFMPVFEQSMSVQVTATAQLATVIIRRALDVVFCIDATGSMQNTINSVKSRASSFSTDLNNALAARGLDKFDYTRIRAVFYRDFTVDDGTKVYYWGYGWYQNPIPMSASAFFEMPGQNGSLTTFLGTQNAAGGGDEPESGYECINEAMGSSWKKVGDAIPGTAYKIDAVYPVVVLWSDANARPIPDNAAFAKPLYPPAMPRTQAAFTARWNDANVIDQSNRMLAMFGLCNNGSWSLARSLTGYMCAGSLSDGNTNMVNKIADAMVVRYKNLTTRLTH